MVPVYGTIAPLLKTHKRAWLTHNLLLAPSRYNHALHYSFAHTLVPPGPLTATLFGYNSPWGSVWDHDVSLQRSDAPAALDGRVTPAGVTAWLRALATVIALPPSKPYDVMTQHYAAALPLWLSLIHI